MTRTDDDFSLVSACLAGRSDAFGVLVQRYQDRVYPTLYRLTGNVEDAHDLMQEAFLRAYQNLGRFHGESGFYTWLYRIAVNLALTDRRKRKGPTHAAVSGFETSIDPPDDPSQTDPSGPIQRAERVAQVQQALNALQADHRAVIVMKELDGFRYEEIADMLGIPLGTVRSRLHRARCELKQRLGPMIEGEPARASSLARD